MDYTFFKRFQISHATIILTSISVGLGLSYCLSFFMNEYFFDSIFRQIDRYGCAQYMAEEINDFPFIFLFYWLLSAWIVILFMRNNKKKT